MSLVNDVDLLLKQSPYSALEQQFSSSFNFHGAISQNKGKFLIGTFQKERKAKRKNVKR